MSKNTGLKAQKHTAKNALKVLKLEKPTKDTKKRKKMQQSGRTIRYVTELFIIG
jgi:hypothetical protein